MSDNVFWVSLWAVILAAFVTLVSLLQYNYCKHVSRMAELGFQEEMVVGSPQPIWRKAAGPVKPSVSEAKLASIPDDLKEEK